MFKPIRKLLLRGLLLFSTAIHLPVHGQMLTAFYPEEKPKSENQKQQNLKPLISILNSLEEKYKVSFYYDTEIVSKKSGDLNILEQYKKAKVEEALLHLLQPLNLMPKKVKDGYYLILPGTLPKEEKSNTNTIQNSSSQATIDVTVAGKVTSEAGEPLIGVTVVLKGTTTGTSTDVSGNYSLTVPDNGGTLVFSYIGFLTKEVAVGNATTLNVTLTPDAKALDEVVVVGYGTVKKSDITGSVVSLKPSDLTPGPNVNIQQTLQGRTAGVQISQKSGEPGAAMTVQIRGITSITGNNDPLYVIDGLPMNDQAAIGASTPQGATNSPNNRTAMNSLNPADIESIEILKDASATAIYGSRGANGVVLITTKRGKTGGLQVNYNGSYGIQNATRVQRYMTGPEYTEAINGIIDLGSLSTEKVTTTNNTDWQKTLLRQGSIQSHDISFSGAGGNTKYFMSLGYFDQEGIMLMSGTKRYNARVNVENSIAQKYNVGISLATSYSRDDFNASGVGLNAEGSALYMAQNYDPTVPIYNTDGSYFRSMNPLDNPVALINGQYSQGDTYRTFGNLYAEYFLIPSLSAKVRVGADINDSQRNLWIDPTTLTGLSYNGFADVRDGKRGYYLGEVTLNFNKTLATNHNISAVAGSTYERYTSSSLSANSRGFALPDLTFNALGTGDNTLNGVGSGRAENKLISFLGRVNYSYKGKYLATASMRADGSSRFGPNNRFGYFPSAALAWRVNDEAFLKNIDVISDLKLRVSYGVTGNQPDANYIYFSTYSAGRNAVFNGNRVSSLDPTRSPNPDLLWESAHQFDAGLDFALLNSRIQGSIEYYNRKTSDLLYDTPQAISSGYNTKTENVGSMRNTGMEFMLNGTLINTSNLKWNLSANITSLKNKVLSLGSTDQLIYGGAGNIGSIGILKPGESIGSYYGYIVDGVWQTTDDFDTAQPGVRPGDLKYRDIDGNNVINADDRVILGKSLPDFFYGFNTGVSYKWASLDIFFEGSQGAKLLNSSLIDSYFPVDLRRNKLAELYLNRWTPDNPTNLYPSFLPNDVQGLRQVNSRTVEDASYLRLQSIRLAVQVPVPKNRYIRNASVFLNGQNLYTWTNYSGSDPMANSLGSNILRLDYNSYPLTRTFTTGINLQF